MPSRFLILGTNIKPQKATQKPTALAKATTLAVQHPGVEIHLYELHTSVRQDPDAPNGKQRTAN